MFTWRQGFWKHKETISKTSVGGLGPSYITIFVGIVVVFAVGQYTILAFVKSERKDIEYRVSSHITGRLIDKAVTISQYALLAILASVILQMVFTSIYIKLSCFQSESNYLH